MGLTQHAAGRTTSHLAAHHAGLVTASVIALIAVGAAQFAEDPRRRRHDARSGPPRRPRRRSRRIGRMPPPGDHGAATVGITACRLPARAPTSNLTTSSHDFRRSEAISLTAPLPARLQADPPRRPHRLRRSQGRRNQSQAVTAASQAPIGVVDSSVIDRSLSRLSAGRCTGRSRRNTVEPTMRMTQRYNKGGASMTSNGHLVDTEQRPLKTWRQVHEESRPGDRHDGGHGRAADLGQARQRQGDLGGVGRAS